MAGAPLGNNNASKGKMVKSIIEKRLEERAALTKMVDKLIDQAEEGDKLAMGMIFDRVDGKPGQTADVNLNGNLAIERIERVITDPANRDTESVPAPPKA